jgi:hypothetical protein
LAGYKVEVNTDGSLHFEVYGDKTGLIEVIGLHKYVESQIDTLIDTSWREYGINKLARLLIEWKAREERGLAKLDKLQVEAEKL